LVRSADLLADMTGLRVELQVSPRVRHSESVAITIRLTNETSRTLDATFVGRTITCDVIVRDVDRRVVWRRLEGEVVPMVLQLRTFAPGEVVELAIAWDQRGTNGAPVTPGSYLVSGEVPTGDPEPLRTPEMTMRIDAG
jgi:hypothetical protein